MSSDLQPGKLYQVSTGIGIEFFTKTRLVGSCAELVFPKRIMTLLKKPVVGRLYRVVYPQSLYALDFIPYSFDSVIGRTCTGDIVFVLENFREGDLMNPIKVICRDMVGWLEMYIDWSNLEDIEEVTTDE